MMAMNFVNSLKMQFVEPGPGMVYLSNFAQCKGCERTARNPWVYALPKDPKSEEAENQRMQCLCVSCQKRALWD